MSNNNDGESCEDCIYWDYHGRDTYEDWEDKDAVFFSDCRRYPPISGTHQDVAKNHTGNFPVTTSLDWCGEFRRKTK